MKLNQVDPFYKKNISVGREKCIHKYKRSFLVRKVKVKLLAKCILKNLKNLIPFSIFLFLTQIKMDDLLFFIYEIYFFVSLSL